MRSDLRRISLTTLAVAALSASAFAGFRTEQQVYIFDDSKFANGDLGYTQRTSDNVQYIGCFVAGDAGYCFAQDKWGVARSCWSDDATWVRVMAAVSGDSYLTFNWDAGGYCTDVTVKNGSVAWHK